MAPPGQIVEPPQEEERRQNRPYRRFVLLLFLIAIAGLAGTTLRGIIRALDRLPSVDTLYRPDQVDVRALRACAEDLERLEARIRKSAGEALARSAPDPEAEWPQMARTLEHDRLSIVARCHLNDANDDPALKDLATAAALIEDLIRSYSLLYDRHRVDGLRYGEDARRAIERATTTLKTRK